MTLKDDLKAYRARWAEVQAVDEEERRNAPYELRWRQLNAAFAMGMALGLQGDEASEMEVWERWARLKENADRT